MDKIKSKFIPSNYKWTKEKCHEESLKYEHRIDFKLNSKGAYPAACLNGWLDEICSHMIPLGNKYKRKIYRYIFPDNYCYVGLTHNPIKRKKAHLTTNSSVYNHIIETGLDPKYEELTDYIDIDDAKKQEEYWKVKSEEEGFTILNKAKTGALGSNDIKWTKEKCKEEALKYNSRSDFYYGSCSAWDRARRNGWLDEICSHMIELRKPDDYWNIDKCKEEAYRYKTKNDLRKNNSYVYVKLRKKGLLDTIYPIKNN